LENQNIQSLFGIFDSKPIATDCAKYNGLFVQNANVVIEEVTLNILEEI